jgi:hypothetical protein
MRFLTPSAFLFALLMLTFPWLEIRCDGESMVKQTGFQTMTGHYTLHNKLKYLREHPEIFEEPRDRLKPEPGKAGREGGGRQNGPVADAPKFDSEQAVDSAWLVVIWAGLVFLGGSLGVVLSRGLLRALLLGALASAALVCLLSQAFVLQFPAFRGKEKPGKQFMPPEDRARFGVEFNLKFGFWLAAAGTAMVLPTALAEMVLSKQRRNSGEGNRDSSGTGHALRGTS